MFDRYVVNDFINRLYCLKKTTMLCSMTMLCSISPSPSYYCIHLLLQIDEDSNESLSTSLYHLLFVMNLIYCIFLELSLPLMKFKLMSAFLNKLMKLCG